jgi:hypothetical protein
MERRKYLRIKVDLPSHVAGEGPAESNLEGSCFSIGGGGFGFILDRPIAVGAWLTVEIELGKDVLHARAVVVGSEPCHENPGKWRVSTRLEEIPDEDRERLNNALRHG